MVYLMEKGSILDLLRPAASSLPDPDCYVWADRAAVEMTLRPSDPAAPLPQVWLVGGHWMVQGVWPEERCLNVPVVPDVLEVPLDENGEVF